MFRPAAKRLIGVPLLFRNEGSRIIRVGILTANPPRRLSTTSKASDAFSNQSPNASECASSSSTSASESSSSAFSSEWAKEEAGRNHHESHKPRLSRPRAQYQDEQAHVLSASLRYVNRLGWTEGAMIAGARDVGISPSIVGSFPRKDAALVEFFMDDCLQKLIDIIDSGEDLQNMIPSKRIARLVRLRLEMQGPYISKWPQALSIQAQPLNLSTSFKQRAMLVDEIWHAAGDESADVDWYVKRTVLGGIYSSTEVYMLTDSSPDFRNTWVFLDGRVRDAFDLKKTIQEAKYLAEAVGAGMGSSVQGFIKKVFQS